MARNHGSQIKWGLYALAYLVLAFLKLNLLNHLPYHGAFPELAPIAAAAVGCFEGPFSGSLYGMGVGLFCCSVYYRGGSMMIPICTLAGLLSGFTYRLQIGRNFLGVSLCGTLSVFLMEGVRLFYYHFFGGNDMEVLMRIAKPEVLYSLLFVIPIYFLFVLIYVNYRTDMEL